MLFGKLREEAQNTIKKELQQNMQKGVVIHKFLFDWIKYPQSYINKISRYAEHMVTTKLTSKVYAKDRQMLFLHLEVMYHIKPDNVEYVLRTLGVGYKEAYIVPTVDSIANDIAVLYTLDQIFNYDTRKIVKETILQNAKKQLAEHKVEVDNITFNIEFTPRYKKMLEQKQLLEEKFQKMKLESELAKEEAKRREREKYDELSWAIKKAAAQREQKLKDAQAERDAKILKAEGEVKALLKVQKIISENPQILRYLYKVAGFVFMNSLKALSDNVLQPRKCNKRFQSIQIAESFILL